MSKRQTDLHHQLPVQRLHWSHVATAPARPTVPLHPPVLLRAAYALIGVSHVGTLVYWMFYASHEPFRRAFIEPRGASTTTLWVAACVTVVTHSVLPLVIARHLYRHRRIPIANGLRAVLASAVVGTTLLLWAIFGQGATPSLGMVGAVLLLLAYLLFAVIRNAMLVDDAALH